MSSLRGRLAVFVLVVALSVSAVAGAGMITNQGSTERPTVDQAHLQPGATDVPELERGGEISFDDDGTDKTVVIDVAHANDVSRSDLQPVVSALTAEGHTVKYHAQGQSGLGQDEPEVALAETLQDADAMIVVDPGTRYTSAEADVVSEFADAGGRVMIAAGPETGGTASILLGSLTGTAAAGGGEIESVSSPLGIAYDTGYLYDMENYETNYQTIGATPAVNSTLTDGVERVVFDAPTPVATDGTTLLTTPATTEHSESRTAGEYGVVARSGNTVAVGDTGFMTTATHNIADNEVLIGNVLEFLVTGDKASGAPSVPGEQPQPGAGAGAGAGVGAGTGTGAAGTGAGAGN